MTRSASTGCSLARRRPISTRVECTERPAIVAVGTGQIHVLEHAALGFGVGEARGAHAVGVDGQQFAGLDLADERRTDDVERGGLDWRRPSRDRAAQAQRAHAVRVTRGVEGVLVHEGQAERAAQLRQQFHRGRSMRAVRRGVRQQRGDDVGVGGGAGHLRAAIDHTGADQAEFACATGQFGGVHQVAVVAERQAGADRGGAEYRLRVLPGDSTGRGVAAVSDGDMPRHGREGLLVEDLGLTRPRSLKTRTWEPSETAIPAASCPRCCRAYRP